MTGRPRRRLEDSGPGDSPNARRRRLVRHITADPVLVAWLAESKAQTLIRAARRLRDDGHREAAGELLRIAADLRMGNESPF